MNPCPEESTGSVVSRFETSTSGLQPIDLDPIELDMATMAALYALGAVSSRASENFEALLLGGDAECVREWERIRPAAEMLARMALPEEPSAAVRMNLVEMIKADGTG